MEHKQESVPGGLVEMKAMAYGDGKKKCCPYHDNYMLDWLMVMGRKKVALTFRKYVGLADGDG
jgi:hypothetical protein